jgi:nucleotide-binding universal stress UspA family protein
MERIVVGIDGETPSTRAVEWVTARAATREVAVELVAVFDSLLSELDAVQLRLDGVREAFCAAVPGTVVTISLVEGAIPDALRLRSLDADLLVIGAHRSRPVRSTLTGSLSARIAAMSACPTVVIPDDWSRAPSFGPVLVGFEVEGSSDSALVFAAQEAEARGSELHIVHSWRSPPSSASALGVIIVERPQERSWHRRLLASAAREIADEFPGLSIREEVSDSLPAVALEQFGRSASLIVVGTHGRGPVAELLLGSTSHELMRHSATPLCIVPVREELPVAVRASGAVRLVAPSADRGLEGVIRRRLASATAIGDDEVDVSVEQGRVRLSGAVGSFSERAMCAEVAESVAGQGSVQNELHVRRFDEGWQLSAGAPVRADHSPLHPW